MLESAMFGALAVRWFVWLAVLILTIAAWWNLFEKAGEPGWAAIVPGYNIYVLSKISWGNGWVFLSATVLYIIAAIIGKTDAASDNIALTVLTAVFYLVFIVISIITNIKLAKAFGKGGGWAVGLIFLNTIFICIMGLSKNIAYVGVPGKTPVNTAGDTQSTVLQQGYQNPYTNQAAEATTSESKFCNDCGTRLEYNEKFCQKCGKEQ